MYKEKKDSDNIFLLFFSPENVFFWEHRSKAITVVTVANLRFLRAKTQTPLFRKSPRRNGLFKLYRGKLLYCFLLCSY